MRSVAGAANRQPRERPTIPRGCGRQTFSYGSHRDSDSRRGSRQFIRPEPTQSILGAMAGNPVRSPSRPVARPVDARSGFRDDAPGGFASVPIRDLRGSARGFRADAMRCAPSHEKLWERKWERRSGNIVFSVVFQLLTRAVPQKATHRLIQGILNPET